LVVCIVCTGSVEVDATPEVGIVLFVVSVTAASVVSVVGGGGEFGWWWWWGGMMMEAGGGSGFVSVFVCVFVVITGDVARERPQVGSKSVVGVRGAKGEEIEMSSPCSPIVVVVVVVTVGVGVVGGGRGVGVGVDEKCSGRCLMVLSSTSPSS
jgi:hypothetical protein